MNIKSICLQRLSCLLFLNLSAIAKPAVTPTTAPYYGTATYPYWGTYVNTPISSVKAAPWFVIA